MIKLKEILNEAKIKLSKEEKENVNNWFHGFTKINYLKPIKKYHIGKQNVGKKLYRGFTIKFSDFYKKFSKWYLGKGMYEPNRLYTSWSKKMYNEDNGDTQDHIDMIISYIPKNEKEIVVDLTSNIFNGNVQNEYKNEKEVVLEIDKPIQIKIEYICFHSNNLNKDIANKINIAKSKGIIVKLDK